MGMCRLIYLKCVLVATVVHAYPYMLACDRNINKGAVIMGAAVAESGENPIRLADASGEIPCGGSLAHGASGLKFSWPFAASLQHFIIEATASAGDGDAWGIEGGLCGKTRAVDTVARKFTVPPGGSVAVRAAWATGFGTPSVTTTCEYTVQCPPGYSGKTCETSQCAAQRVPSAVQPTASYPTGHVCVPEWLRQHADVAHCAVEESWLQILKTMPLSDRFTMGGLGKLMAIDEFEVWLCDKQAPCMLANAEVCYVFSERHLVFVPWGKRVNVLATQGTTNNNNVTARAEEAGMTPPPPPAVGSGDDVSFDFSNTVKQAHPGSGSEYETLVYIELAGGLDGAAVFVNVKNEEEVHLWCSKRPALSAAEYCECAETSTDGECRKYALLDGSSSRRSGIVKVTRLPHTEEYLGLTDLVWRGGGTGWLELWKEGKMAVVPGLGRKDHGRSHFEVKDAAAKGVTIELEKETSNGWLAKSIFGYNNLFCTVGQDPCPPPPGWQAPPNVDGISLGNAAAGPNALEASRSIAKEGSFNHMTGLKSVDEIVESDFSFLYKNPFAMMMEEMEEIKTRGFRSIHHSKSQRGQERDQVRAQEHARELKAKARRKQALRAATDAEMWAQRQTNLGLEELLRKEHIIFEGLGIMQDKLDEYKANLATLCPAGFPDVPAWASSESDAEIGMQLRAVAILLANGVAPKVFQVQQTGYDTHSNQGTRLKTLLSDLRTAVYTFVRTAEACGFWERILITSFSDFGRRLEENSRKGTDHGWGSYSFVFGHGLRRQVLGYNADVASKNSSASKNASDLRHIVPFQADAFDPAKNTKGDLLVTTDIETWNACLLNAMALPAIPRLGFCPPEMQLRDGLANMPLFDETLYYKTAAGSGSTGGGGSSRGLAPMPVDSGMSHLTTPLTPSEVLHFARRVGFSAKSLGLQQFVLPNMTSVIQQDSLRCGDAEGVVMVVNPGSSQRSYCNRTTSKGSMLNQTNNGGAHMTDLPYEDVWLEMDLGKPMLVHGFITQARGSTSCATTERNFSCNTHVTTARIEYRLHAGDAPTALPEIFKCNVVGDIWETVTNRFSAPVLARFVRIYAVNWHRRPTMRAGVLASCVSPTNYTNITDHHPILTLQQGISRALETASQPLVMPAKVYSNYKKRQMNSMNLWSQERREKRNNWRDLTRLPYPRYDPAQRRARRYAIEEYFDWETFVVDPENHMTGTLHVKTSHVGREDEILERLMHSCTIFFYPMPVGMAEGNFDKRLLDSAMPPRLKNASQVDWYRTIMMQPDVRLVTQVTAQMIVDDYKCDTGTHPDDPTIPCNPACDLRKHLTIDYGKHTAMLTDTSATGADGTWKTSSWYILKKCVDHIGDKVGVEKEARAQFEGSRHNLLNSHITKDLLQQFFLDSTKPEQGLWMRMTWFFLNFYATPSTIVNDALLMYRQYETLFNGALGNYRSLSLQMFTDEALRKSLDQLEEVECGAAAPIENFAREWFERFTVGLESHNEGDVKRLAKGLMNCKEDAGTFNEDLVTHGIIFSDINETLWTLTDEEQRNVVDRILDFKMRPDEPPVAAQFLCSKLYQEFAILPTVREGDARASSVGFAPEVVSCARHFYDHNYDITFALEHILVDKKHFRDSLGTKQRWPLALLIEAMTDFGWPQWSESIHFHPGTWFASKANEVGMRPFEPADVSGWDLDSVWTNDRITKAHEFLHDNVRGPAIAQFSGWSTGFADRKTTEKKLEPYYMGPEQRNKYSYSKRFCGRDCFIEEVGKEGQHMIDLDALSHQGWNKTTVGRAWQRAQELAIVNVCQFVC